MFNRCSKQNKSKYDLINKEREKEIKINKLKPNEAVKTSIPHGIFNASSIRICKNTDKIVIKYFYIFLLHVLQRFQICAHVYS